MKMSKKEKMMLSVLGIVFVGFIYYEFVYSYLAKIVDTKAAQEQEIEQKYNNAKATLDAMESQKSKVKILNAKIEEEASPIYPTISQEHIILEIDKLLKDAGLEGGMEFDAVECDTVDALKKSEKDKGYLESSMQKIADEYNNNGEKKYSDNTNSQNSSDEANKNNNSSGTENKIIKMKGKVKFYGTYESVVKFAKAINEREKRICLYAVGMDINDSKWVKGEFGIAIYSVPKINDEINNYLNWTLNNAYGKKEPFQLNQSAGSGVKYDRAESDFMISAKSPSSDLPTIIMGKSNDALKSTYVYADGNDKEKAEIIFSEEGSKYYYKYKTDNGSMPSNYSNECEFTPNRDIIVISIQSERRLDSNDKSGLKLNIVNNTDKLVKVDINGDDKDAPRISIDGDSKNISVSQK